MTERKRTIPRPDGALIHEARIRTPAPPHFRFKMFANSLPDSQTGRSADMKKTLKTKCFQGFVLVSGVGFEPTTFRLCARGPASNSCCWARGIGENQGRTSQLRRDPFLSTARYQKSLIDFPMPALPRECSFKTASASPVRTEGRDHYASDVQLFVLQLYCIASGRLGHGCDASLV